MTSWFPFESASPEQTRQLGERCAAVSARGDVFVLSGPVGSGKTQFVKGFCRGLGIDESDVTSPTFAIAQEYQGSIPIIHIDLYRIESDVEAVRSGIESYLDSDASVLIEWPEMALSLIPQDAVFLRFQHRDQESRVIELLAVDDGQIIDSSQA